MNRAGSIASRPPADLRIGVRTYQLSEDDSDWSWMASVPFARVPGKTDSFFLYRSTHQVRPEILLQTPATLRLVDSSLVGRKARPWSYTTLLQPHLLRLPAPAEFGPGYVERVLGYDKMTESDSLRLFNYMAANSEMPHEFWPVIMLWLRDEINHCRGFTEVYHRLFGHDDSKEDRLSAELSDFDQFGSILRDPFASLVTLAYDEASTISGYRHDMPIYRAIGASMVAFVGRVAADEGWHFSKFVNLLVKYFPARLDEVTEVLNDAMDLDGRPYKRTFLLDHDPRVEAQFTEALKRRAAGVVGKAIEKKRAASRRR